MGGESPSKDAPVRTRITKREALKGLPKQALAEWRDQGLRDAEAVERLQPWEYITPPPAP